MEREGGKRGRGGKREKGGESRRGRKIRGRGGRRRRGRGKGRGRMGKGKRKDRRREKRWREREGRGGRGKIGRGRIKREGEKKTGGVGGKIEGREEGGTCLVSKALVELLQSGSHYNYRVIPSLGVVIFHAVPSHLAHLHGEVSVPFSRGSSCS
jgi:hypothetical protein